MAPEPTHKHKLPTQPLFERSTSPPPTPGLRTRSSTLSLRGKRRDHGSKAVIDKSLILGRQNPYWMEVLYGNSERQTTDTDSVLWRPKSAQSVFVRTLYNMLEDQSIQHLVSWSNTNDAFVLSPSSEFAKVLLSHFRHTSISSFVRQLNMYGFYRVRDEFPNDSLQWVFKHADGMFHRGGPVAALTAIEFQDCKEGVLREADPETTQGLRESPPPEDYALPNLGSLIAGWQATLSHDQAERISSVEEGDMVDAPQSWAREIEGNDALFLNNDSADLQSACSSASSPINNPKLLATAENAIKRIVLPELLALRNKQSTQGDRSAIEDPGEHVVESRQTALKAPQCIVEQDPPRQNSNAPNPQNHRNQVLSRSASAPDRIHEQDVLVGEETSSDGSKVCAGTSGGNGSDCRLHRTLRSPSALDTNSSRESLLSSHEDPECASDTSSTSHRDVNVHNALYSAMNVVKGLMLQKLVVHALTEATGVIGGHGPSSRTFGGVNAISTSQSSTNATKENGGKRARGGGRDPDDEGGDDSEEDDNPPKKKSPSHRAPQRRLKCPFYQREPEKYTKAACRGEGFAEMGKLKDHLKRVHMHPLRCRRCHIEMSEEELEAHMFLDKICTKRPAPADDRMAPQTLWKLDFKRAPFVNARSTEEKWKMLYRMLFPADAEESIPSSYNRNEMSPDLARALSEALEKELNEELAQFIEPIITRIKARIPAIIERCRTTLATRAINTFEDPNVRISLPESSQSRQVASELGRLRKKSNSSAQSLNNSSKVYSRPGLTVSEVKRKQPQYSPVPQMPSSGSSEGSEETSMASASASTDNITPTDNLAIVQCPGPSANITGVGDWHMYDSTSVPLQLSLDTSMLDLDLPPPCQIEQNPALRPYHNDPYLYGGAAFGANGMQDWSTMATVGRKGSEGYPPPSEQLLNGEHGWMQSTHWQVPPRDHLPPRWAS
ncbi:flocculation suppression protein [Paraphaeosphaeria minitans]|uniref:Flocculation suppression protein n=1 Tax=Paraphaeosphaeria minitans TaxID=565426 RepID=A0A9P6KT91_9PLEO|nr:flocculation suppression protein [Paraphaeosphaeria minitans]